MNPHVALEVDSRSEGLAALPALVVPFPGVDLAVDGEGVPPGELLAAELALELLGGGVERLAVVLEVAVLPERFSAVAAIERLLF